MSTITPGGIGSPSHPVQGKVSGGKKDVSIGAGRKYTKQSEKTKVSDLKFAAHRQEERVKTPKASATPPDSKIAKKVNWTAGKGELKGAYKQEFLSARSTSFAAEKGDLFALRLLRERGIPWDEDTCAKAIRGGHIELFEWAVENGAPLNMSVAVTAARKGDVETLHELRTGTLRGMEEGMEFDHTVCEAAAESGEISTLKYLLQNDAPYTSDLVKHAGKSGSRLLIEWMLSNYEVIGKTGPHDEEGWNKLAFVDQLTLGAAEAGHKNIVEWLEKKIS